MGCFCQGQLDLLETCRHEPHTRQALAKDVGWSEVRNRGGDWDPTVGPSGCVVGEWRHQGRTVQMQLLVQAFAGLHFAPTRVVHQDGLM